MPKCAPAIPEPSVPGEAEIRAATTALARGEVVVYPTETFYGLAVDALDVAALARLCELKGRGADKAVSLLIVGEAMLARLVAEVPPRARALMAAHWPGALTIALPARPGLPAALVAGGFVALRESPHPMARALVSAFAGPITATSANPAGGAPARSAAEARAFFPECVVVDGGDTPGGLASTLVRVRGEELEVLRQGAVRVDGHGVLGGSRRQP
jgi:L-threonylcarbamoyladenylate synthase